MDYWPRYKTLTLPALRASAYVAYGAAALAIFFLTAMTCDRFDRLATTVIGAAKLALTISTALFIASIPYIIFIGIPLYLLLIKSNINSALVRCASTTVTFQIYLSLYLLPFPFLNMFFTMIVLPLGLIAFPLCGELFHRMVSAKQCRLEEGQAPLPLAVSHQPSGQDDAGGDHGDD